MLCAQAVHTYPVSVIITHSTQIQLVLPPMLLLHPDVMFLCTLHQYGYVLVGVHLGWLQVLLRYIDVRLMLQVGIPDLCHRLRVQSQPVSPALPGHPAHVTINVSFLSLTATAFTFIWWFLQYNAVNVIALNKIHIISCHKFFQINLKLKM